ncbi:MAG: type II toxin-antitoxin system HicB family antitoxin [Minisyncoccia bacterium]
MMEKPRIIQFFIEKAEEGGYCAKAVLFPIFTQGETLDEVVKNIQEAVFVHFDSNEAKFPVLVNFELPVTA